jgi:hypothetical protein
VEQKKSVLLVGIDPVMIDFSSADFAPQNLSADRVMSALLADNKRLRELGYDADLCLTDLGETAERVVADKLKAKAYDCVLVGAAFGSFPAVFCFSKSSSTSCMRMRRRRNCASIPSPATLLKPSCAGFDARPVAGLGEAWFTAS